MKQTVIILFLLGGLLFAPAGQTNASADQTSIASIHPDVPTDFATAANSDFSVSTRADSVAATIPEDPESLSIAERAANEAMAMIGAPYKYRGENPEGFDCSGLIRYSFNALGIDTPHNTKALRKVSARVKKQGLMKGDLLFFNERGRKFSHVGIYFGDGYFIHAPGRHKYVRMNNLGDRHWKRRFVEARRIS